MPKIFGNSLGNYNKSYCTFHQESNKIGFAFFWIFYDFLQNLQVSAINQTLFKMQVSTKPLKVLDSLRVGPWFADRPLEKTGDSQLGPQAPAGGGPTKFRRTGSRDRSGAGGGWSAGSLGSISTGGWGGSGAGGVVRRRRPLSAAVRPAPARWQLGGKRERVSEL
jgi:hypothetical protein